MSKASIRIGIAAGFVGIFSIGTAVYLYFRDSLPFLKPAPVVVLEACGEFLINDPEADLLKTAPPSQQERAKLLEKMECYRRQLSQDARYADAYTNLGEASRRLEDLVTAREMHRKALQLNPKLQQAKLGLALVEQESGNAQAAIAAIQEVIGIKESAIAYFYQGATLYKQGSLKEAEAAFRKAIELDPKYAEARVNLGLALNQQGDVERAIKEIREAILINPNLAEAHFNLGVILQAHNQLEEAISAYQEVIRLNSNHAEANYNLGVALKEQGRAAEAMAAYREVIRINPNYTTAYVNLGANLADQGKPEEAIAPLRKAIRLKPDEAEAYNNLGVALYKRNLVAEAIPKLQDAIRINPNYAEAHHNLGVALASQGKLEEAIATLRRAKNLYQTQGNNQKAEGIKQALRQIGVQ